MELIYKLYNLAATEEPEPLPWGRYHVLWVLGVLALTAILCTALKDCKDMGFRVCILALFGIMLIFEIYKQIFFSMEMVDGVLTFNYNWGNFPFQLCSTPLYVLPFLGILRDGPVRDFAASYTVSFTLLGGLVVYLFPSTVFDVFVVGNVQTMTHHGIQIVTGIFTAVWYRKRLNRSFFMKGALVFTVMFTVAMLLNTVGREALISIGAITSETNFNMFMISPYFDINPPIFEELVNSIDPWLFVVIYFIGVPVVAAALMFGCEILVNGISRHRGKTLSAHEKKPLYDN